MKHHKLVGIIAVSGFAKHVSKKTLSESILEAIWHYQVGQCAQTDKIPFHIRLFGKKPP